MELTLRNPVGHFCRRGCQRRSNDPSKSRIAEHALAFPRDTRLHSARGLEDSGRPRFFLTYGRGVATSTVAKLPGAKTEGAPPGDGDGAFLRDAQSWVRKLTSSIQTACARKSHPT